MADYTLGQLSRASGLSRKRLKVAAKTAFDDGAVQQSSEGAMVFDEDQVRALSSEVDRRKVKSGKLPVRMAANLGVDQ